MIAIALAEVSMKNGKMKWKWKNDRLEAFFIPPAIYVSYGHYNSVCYRPLSAWIKNILFLKSKC
jgi:hypothetical protein